MIVTTNVPILDVASRLLVALLLGALIGWNRERLEKPAGLRTHMLVTLGAAAFVLLGIEVIAELSPQYARARLDPTRVIEGVVGGIGFLGAGAIIQARGKVSGVTTAAGVWVSGAIGAACGAGAYLLAVLCAALTWLTLAGLGVLEQRALGKDESGQRSVDSHDAPAESGAG